YGFHVAIGSDDSLVPPAFRLERLRALTPAEIAALPAPVAVPEVDEDEEDEVEIEVAAQEAPRDASTEAQPERADGEEAQGRRRRRRRRRGGRRDENRDVATPASPASPSQEIALSPEATEAPPADPAAAVEAPHGEEQRGSEQRADGAPGEPGGRKRRRRGRRGGRRRRRGEPGQDLASGEHSTGEATPIAEAVEYVPPTSGYDDAAAEMAEALHASPAPEMRIENGAESVPVAERGDQAPEAAAPPSAAGTAPDVGGHDVSSDAPANPKR